MQRNSRKIRKPGTLLVYDFPMNTAPSFDLSGRGALVTVTVAGRDLVDAAMHDLVAREEQLLRQLDGPQRDALADTLRRLLVPLESSAEVPDPAAAPGGTS